MFEYLMGSITREARAAYKAQPWAQGGESAWTRNFCKGAADRVYARCKKLREEAERPQHAAASTGTAIVLASVYAKEMEANKALIAAQVGKLRSPHVHQTVSHGYSEGAEYGERVSLNRQIGGGGEGGGAKRLK